MVAALNVELTGTFHGMRFVCFYWFDKTESLKIPPNTFRQIGTTDLPTMIDQVLHVTRYEKLHYIGHSQGTTSFFVMCSERPEYNDRILSMQALAPVAFMSNLRSPFVRAAAAFLNTLDVRPNLEAQKFLIFTN